MNVRICPAEEIDLALVRVLLQEYIASLDHDIGFQEPAEELATLPGAYAPPHGRLLLALVQNELAGCVALRPLDAERCEMKRLYVRPAFRGLRLGRQLVVAILDEARRAGYRSIYLDTLPSMSAAVALYRSLGFQATDAYCHNPIADAVFLKRDL
jgi:ribosomal protein S18 acetylase RimI-like enzyme